MKSVSGLLVVSAACLSLISCATAFEIGVNTFEIQARQAPTQRPLLATTAKPGAPTQKTLTNNANTAKPGNVAGGINTAASGGGVAANIVVEIQTPPTTPSNMNSVINAKPAENRPIAPMTTPKPNIAATVTVKTTPKPNIAATVTVKTTAKPTTLPLLPCPVNNIMAIKTGNLAAADPCSYVSCIRADSSLYCAQVKCDPGQAFSAATGRCSQSNLCAAIKPAAKPAVKPK